MAVSELREQDPMRPEEALLGDIIHDQEEDKRERHKLSSELTLIFNALDRVANLMRVYPKRHPLVDSLTEQVNGIIGKVLEQHLTVKVTLHASDIKLEGRDVCFSRELSDREDYIWYEPYADGLVWFSFEEGLTAKELMNFMDIIVRVNAGNVGDDDDTTTLLWELDSPHIDFESLEGFIDGGVIDELGCSEPEAVDRVVDYALSPNEENAGLVGSMFVKSLGADDLDVFTRMHLKAAEKKTLPRMADDDISYAFGMDQAAMTKLRDEWGAGLNLEYRLIETLLSIIRTAPKSSAGERASGIISEVTMQLLDKEQIHAVVTILKLLHARRKLLEFSNADPLADLVELMTAPFQLEATLNLFEKEPDKREDIAQMLSLLSPTKVQAHLLKVLSNPGQIANEETLVTILLDISKDELEMALTSGEMLKQKEYIRRMLFALTRRECAEWEPARRLIRVGLEHPDDQLKMLAMAVTHPFFENTMAAEKYLSPMSLQGSAEVRQRALELLAKFHRPLFLAAVKENLLEGKFKGRSHGEIRFLMRTYITHVEEAPSMLRAMVDVSGLFNDEAREFGRLAALTLIENQDEQVVEVLRRRAKALFSSPKLKKQYREILTTTGLGMEDAPAEAEAEVEVEEASA